MAPAKFQQPPQAPPLFTGTSESIVKDTRRLIDENKRLLDRLAKDIKPEDATFDNVMLEMAHAENEMALESRLCSFYQAVSAKKELRDASTEADTLMDEYGIAAATREDIFKLVDGAWSRKEGQGLDTESQRLLEKERKDYIKFGLSLPAGEKRDRFKEIKLRLSQLGIAFNKNLNEENGEIYFTPEQLEGVPKDVISGFPEGTGENEGKLKVTFKYPDLFPISKYAKNASVRKELLIANENKIPRNIPLFSETIVLRDEAARLLGYPNHAAFRLEDKMAKTPDFVDNFLGDLRTKLTPGGEKELKVLKDIKKADVESRGEKFDGRYYFWDHRYYSTLQLERDYQLDQEKISEYFPLKTTLSGMLEIFEQLLGLQFFELTGEDRTKVSPTGKGEDIVWHEDVQLFAVYDDKSEGEGFVGYLYTDLHPREGKYGHAANFNLQPGFISRNATRRYPATALVCNFSKPTEKKPSLLKHDEVVTLFHELGHGIHDLVSKTRFSRFHGTAVVGDFVEAPSQMLENWCWTPSQLRSLSRHYSTMSDAYLETWKSNAGANAKPPAKEIPEELVDAIINTKHINDALANLRQLHFGTFDMKVHEPASHDAIEKMDFTETYNKLRSEITLQEGPEANGEGYQWGHGQTTFGHLMGGYDAGYYGYLSSQVYSMDMFYSVFKKDPMDGVEGRRYRHAVLEKGGSRDEMESLKDFLGREPDTAAFYKELGIAQ